MYSLLKGPVEAAGGQPEAGGRGGSRQEGRRPELAVAVGCGWLAAVRGAP